MPYPLASYRASHHPSRVRRGSWQFSLRTIFLLILVIGPLAGAFAGTFGSGIQEVVVMMLLVAMLSTGSAVVAAAAAFIIISPLLILESVLRGPRHREPRDRPSAGVSDEGPHIDYPGEPFPAPPEVNPDQE
jgi:hypothetical protein